MERPVPQPATFHLLDAQDPLSRRHARAAEAAGWLAAGADEAELWIAGAHVEGAASARQGRVVVAWSPEWSPDDLAGLARDGVWVHLPLLARRDLGALLEVWRRLGASAPDHVRIQVAPEALAMSTRDELAATRALTQLEALRRLLGGAPATSSTLTGLDGGALHWRGVAAGGGRWEARVPAQGEGDPSALQVELRGAWGRLALDVAGEDGQVFVETGGARRVIPTRAAARGLIPSYRALLAGEPARGPLAPGALLAEAGRAAARAVASARPAPEPEVTVEARRGSSQPSAAAPSPEAADGLARVRAQPPLWRVEHDVVRALLEPGALTGARVALIRVANRDRGAASSAPVLPLGLASLAGFLGRHGARVTLLDRNDQPLSTRSDEAWHDEIRAELDRSSPLLIGVSLDRPADIEDARALIRALPVSTPIVLGGRGAQSLDSVAAERVRMMVATEGELPLALLTRHLLTGEGALGTIPGLTARVDGRGRAAGPLEHALAVRGLPDFGELPARYREGFPGQEPRFPYVYVEGCPFACAYCANYTDRRHQRMGADEAVAGMRALVEAHGARRFMLLNNMANLVPRLLEAFARALTAADLGVTWGDSARPQRFPLALLPTLKASGCEYLVWGLDAGSNRLQRRMDKGLDLDEVAATLEATHRAGVENRVNLIAGLPHETQADLDEARAFLSRVRPWLHAVYLSRYELAVASPIWQDPARYDLQIREGGGFHEIGGLPWEEKQAQIERHHQAMIEHLVELGLRS
jgi:radical SAM superfamily enzyme YgiQ (UPF0313 family)